MEDCWNTQDIESESYKMHANSYHCALVELASSIMVQKVLSLDTYFVYRHASIL